MYVYLDQICPMTYCTNCQIGFCVRLCEHDLFYGYGPTQTLRPTWEAFSAQFKTKHPTLDHFSILKL
jgi:hypothetical protein